MNLDDEANSRLRVTDAVFMPRIALGGFKDTNMIPEGMIAQIASQGFGGLLTNLATSYFNKATRQIKQDKEVIRRDLTDHLQITFNKCMNVKTILNSDKASQTLEIYVDQQFRIDGQMIDQYALIESIRAGTSCVIIGEGGGGKSMFMRYLWLSYFEKSEGHIPFFLELRNLNSLTHSSIADFLFHSIIKSGSLIRQGEFTNALKSGEFILFLDGFDEINFDRREAVQRMILELKENNPSLTIVVTSRSDERFMGWENFIRATVERMRLENSRLLIERANYDQELKRKFLAKFDTLFAAHSDFLSNPLLAYMMLVTFSHNPDIPKKMFQFYEQSFEALYHRHDLTKGYKRVFHCSLDKFDFIRLVSFFCLKTYYDEQIEFSKLEVLDAINRVKQIENFSVDDEEFLSDLTQSVCLLKLEGLTYTFTHRSFQEYFSAYCIARVASRNLDQLFSKFIKRFGDSVLPMVADMNSDLFQEKFVIPNYERFKDFLSSTGGANLYEEFSERVGAEFHVRQLHPSTTKSGRRKKRPSDDQSNIITLDYKGAMADFFRASTAVANSRGFAKRPDGNSKNDDDVFVNYAFGLLPAQASDLLIYAERGAIRFFSITDDDRKEIDEEISKLLRSAYQKSFMKKFIDLQAENFISFVRNEVDNYNKVTGAFSDFF